MRKTYILTISLLLLSFPALAGWQEGVEAFNAGRYETAEAEFRGFLERSPEAADAHFMLGLTLQRQKRLDEALVALGRAVEIGGHARYALAQGQALLQAGRGDDALKTLAAQDPATLAADLRSSYGKLLSQAATRSSQGRAALAALERAADADPEAKHLQVARAEVARKLELPTTELEALEAVLAIDPADLGHMRRAFRVALNSGRQESAERLARRWAENVGSAESHVALGEALMERKSYAEARGWFEKAATEAGESVDPKLLYYLGSCQVATEKVATEEATAALGQLEKALAATKDGPLRQRILVSKGSALRHLEEFEKAAAVYREVGDAEQVAEMERLAKAQAENGKWDAQRRKCLRMQTEIEATRATMADLKGTPEWEELSEILATCEPYLREEG